MTHLRPLLLAAALLAPVPALAVVDPAPGPKDPRVRSFAYDPQQVTRLTSTGLSPLELILEAGERPLTIAGASVFTDPKEAKDWLARSSGNVLILQPMHSMEPTMLFVRTATADGQDRHYSFELHTREGNVASTDDRAAYMTVQVAYKAVPSPEAIAQWRARRDQAAAVAAGRAVKVRFAASIRSANDDYSKRDPAGCPLLAPSSVSDDGNRTTMVFPPHAVLPEVYAINQDNKEAIVSTINATTPNGLQVVLPSVHRELRLRRGSKVCALRNNRFDPIGTEPGGGTGTSSPDVVRGARAP